MATNFSILKYLCRSAIFTTNSLLLDESGFSTYFFNKRKMSSSVQAERINQIKQIIHEKYNEVYILYIIS